jgi:hypothetical protein
VEFLNALPNTLDRAEVTALCRRAGENPDEAVHGFLAAMIWGYGTVGYGAFRTARVLRENDSAPERLMTVAAQAHDAGGPVAFEALAQNRLHGLGVAFATKFLFFCAASEPVTPAPVLDRLVRDWLYQHAGWSLRLDWHVNDYRDYVDAVCDWGKQLEIDASDVEMLIFTLAATSIRSRQWREPEILGTAEEGSSDEVSLPDIREVLDALDDVEDAFAALPGLAPEDTDDFSRGLRQLRRIVLASRAIAT